MCHSCQVFANITFLTKILLGWYIYIYLDANDGRFHTLVVQVMHGMLPQKEHLSISRGVRQLRQSLRRKQADGCRNNTCTPHASSVQSMLCAHVEAAPICLLTCCFAMLASFKASCTTAHGLQHVLIRSWVKRQIMFHE